MKKTITVKGVGKASLKPDLIVISIYLESLDMEYRQTMIKAESSVRKLLDALESAGFSRNDVKTVSFAVTTRYESYQEENTYKNRFIGYVCEQGLKLEFAFDSDQLAEVIEVISALESNPRLDIRFTVKDQAAVNRLLLESAASSARTKAEILAAASGVTLGELIKIDYNWQDIQIYSPTAYARDGVMSGKAAFAESAPEINPEDIQVSDQVTLVWAIH